MVRPGWHRGPGRGGRRRRWRTVGAPAPAGTFPRQAQGRRRGQLLRGRRVGEHLLVDHHSRPLLALTAGDRRWLLPCALRARSDSLRLRIHRSWFPSRGEEVAGCTVLSLVIGLHLGSAASPPRPPAPSAPHRRGDGRPGVCVWGVTVRHGNTSTVGSARSDGTTRETGPGKRRASWGARMDARGTSDGE